MFSWYFAILGLLPPEGWPGPRDRRDLPASIPYRQDTQKLHPVHTCDLDTLGHTPAAQSLQGQKLGTDRLLHRLLMYSKLAHSNPAYSTSPILPAETTLRLFIHICFLLLQSPDGPHDSPAGVALPGTEHPLLLGTVGDIASFQWQVSPWSVGLTPAWVTVNSIF